MDRYRQKLAKLYNKNLIEPPTRPIAKIWDYFDAAFYINLDYREDRKIASEEQFKLVGIPVQRVSAVRPTNKGRFASIGDRGCSESHIEVIKIAKSLNLNNVLIFEDDIVFDPDFNLYIGKIIEHLRTLEWNMFYFELSQEKDMRTVYKDNKFPFLSIKGTFLTHAYAITADIFDLILDLEKNNALPIDNLYRYKIHSNDKYQVYAVKGLIKQSNSPSDVTYINGPPSTHGNIKTKKIRMNTGIEGEYAAINAYWQCKLTLNNDGSFTGGVDKPDGQWELHNNTLIIKWYHWDHELLDKTEYGFANKQFKLINMKKTLTTPSSLEGLYIYDIDEWTGPLILSRDRTFQAGPERPNGYWEIGDNNITLNWYNWGHNKLQRAPGGFYDPDNIRPKVIKYIPDPVFRMEWDTPHFGDFWCAINMLSDLSEKLDQIVTLYVPNSGYLPMCRDIISAFKADKVHLTTERIASLLIYGEMLYNYPQRILPHLRWKPRDYKRICYQFDGDFAPWKNPPRVDIPKLTTFKTGYQYLRLGKPSSISEIIEMAMDCDVFIGIASGMSHVCLSLGIPVFIIEYGLGLYAFKNSLYHYCHGTRDCIEKVKRYFDAGMHLKPVNEMLLPTLPITTYRHESFTKAFFELAH